MTMTRHSAVKTMAAAPPRPGDDATRDAPVLARLAALKAMTVPELKAEWRRLFGTDAPNNSRPFLELRLAYRIQELIYGGPSRETVRVLDALVDEFNGKPVRKARIADPRKPIAGTRLVREWDGVEHTVTVLRDGFEWKGRKYKSLSAIARAITGTRWNGWRFFGMPAAPRSPR
ncbi:MAG: DUF2924 domain-containing protein [Rhodothalassiaceae bacterium]